MAYAGGVGLVVHARSEAGGLGRSELGRFRNQAEVRRINERLAIGAQANVVELMERRIKRRLVSTGRLVKVTGDPKNRFSDNVGFGVGIEDFLDKSVAKYWRQIEEGTDVHVGQRLYGVWGASKAGFYRDDSWGTALLGGAEYSAHGKRSGGKFIPLGRQPAEADSLVGGARIRRPIEATHSYSDAFHQGGWFSDKPLAEAVRYLDEIAKRAFSFGG